MPAEEKTETAPAAEGKKHGAKKHEDKKKAAEVDAENKEET